METTVTPLSDCPKLFPLPTKDFLMEYESGKFNTIEYFNRYLNARRTKQIIKTFEDQKEACWWRQRFLGDIVYEMESCSIGSITETITFPGYCKDEVTKYVEWFYKEEDYQWNKEKTIRSERIVSESGGGCGISIERNETGDYVLKRKCSC